MTYVKDFVMSMPGIDIACDLRNRVVMGVSVGMAQALNIEYFWQKLQDSRKALIELQDARVASTATVILDQASVGRLSRMDALQQQAMAQNTRQRAELSLRRIEAALARCDDGSYGECLECGETINPRRLELDPSLAFCIECATSRER